MMMSITEVLLNCLSMRGFVSRTIMTLEEMEWQSFNHQWFLQPKERLPQAPRMFGYPWPLPFGMQLEQPSWTGNHRDVWYKVEMWCCSPPTRPPSEGHWWCQTVVYSNENAMQMSGTEVLLNCLSFLGFVSRTMMYVEEMEWQSVNEEWLLRPTERIPRTWAIRSST